MRRAFTLIEILIAATLSCVLLSVIFLSAMTLARSWKMVERNADSLESAMISLDRMIMDARNSNGFGPSSSGAVLVLDNSGSTTSYDLNDGKVRRRVGGGSSYLTEEGRVTHLSFSYPSARLVVLTLVARQGRGEAVFSAEAFVRN